MEKKNESHSINHNEDEIDLRELFFTIKNNIFKILLFVFFITFFTILYTISIPNTYKSYTVLVPEEQEKPSFGGGLSALAGFAGVSLGGGSGLSPENALNEIIKDYEFNKYIIEKHNLIERMSKENVEKNYVFAFNFDKIYRIFNSSVDEKVNDEILFELNKKLKEIILINKDKKSGMILFSVSHVDRFLANELVSIYIEEATKKFRDIELQDVNKKILYYREELSKTSDIDLKKQLNNLISGLIQKKVLAKSNELYFVKQITAPRVAHVKEKEKPKRALIVIVSFVTSFILGIFGIFFLEFIKKDENISDKNLKE